MWRERILTAVLLRDNDAPDDIVRERLADARPLWLAIRVVVLVNLVVMTLGMVLGDGSVAFWLTAVTVLVIHEVNVGMA